MLPPRGSAQAGLTEVVVAACLTVTEDGWAGCSCSPSRQRGGGGRRHREGSHHSRPHVPGSNRPPGGLPRWAGVSAGKLTEGPESARPAPDEHQGLMLASQRPGSFLPHSGALFILGWRLCFLCGEVPTSRLAGWFRPGHLSPPPPWPLIS